MIFEGGIDRFLFKGTNGRWRDVLTDDDLALYDKAAATLDPALRHWLEGGRHAGRAGLGRRVGTSLQGAEAVPEPGRDLVDTRREVGRRVEVEQLRKVVHHEHHRASRDELERELRPERATGVVELDHRAELAVRGEAEARHG